MNIQSRDQVLYINGRFLTQQTTGVQRYARELLAAMDSMIPSSLKFSRVIVLTPTLQDEPPKFLNIEIRQVGKLRGHLWEQVELPFYSFGGLLLSPCNTAPLLSLLFGKAVVTVHDLAFRYFPSAYSLPFRMVYRTMSPLIFRFSKRIITDSEFEKQQMLKYFPRARQKLFAIHLGVDVQRMSALAKESQTSTTESKKPYLLFVGSLNPRKNLANVIKASVELQTRLPVILKMVGPTSKNFLASQVIADLEKCQWIESIPFVSDEKLVELYRDAEMLVFPSFYEGFGFPPLEAMACGCPVLVSSASCFPEICGDAALYCDPTSPSDIADKIEMLLRDRNLAAELRKKGAEHVKRFLWSECAKKTLSLLEASV